MYCKKCGSLLNDGAAFCPNCGQTVAAKPAAPAAGVNVPPPQQPMYGAYPGQVQQPGYGYYGNQSYGRTYSSGGSLKGLFVLAMAVLLVILAIGLMKFGVIKYGKDWFYATSTIGNGDTLLGGLSSTDGDVAEMIGDLVEDGELGGVCVIISFVMMCISILAAVIGALCSLAKSYAASVLMIGIGMLAAALGYIANIVEAIYILDKRNNDFYEYFICITPIFMLVVCLAFAVVSFVASGRVRDNN